MSAKGIFSGPVHQPHELVVSDKPDPWAVVLLIKRLKSYLVAKDDSGRVVGGDKSGGRSVRIALPPRIRGFGRAT